MPAQFFKSDLGAGGKKKHFHMIYVDAARSARNEPPIVAPHEDHVHELVALEDGTYMLSASPVDGHIHQVDFTKPYIPSLSRKKGEVEDDIVAEVLHLFQTALSLESDSRKKGLESEKFYSGEQWDKGVKQSLEDSGRSALVINFTGKYSDELCGHQRQNRTDIRYLPIEGGDQKVADILNIWSKHILEQCFFEREEAKVFFNQCVAGRGAFNIYMDFSKSLQGDAIVESYQWDRVAFGPHEKEDLSDCDYIIKDKMYTMAKVKQLWPKKAKELVDFYDSGQLRGSQPEQVEFAEHEQHTTDQYLKSDNKLPLLLDGSLPLVDTAKKEIRVIECYRKTYEPGVVIANDMYDFYLNAVAWGSRELKQVEAMRDLGFYVVKKDQCKIRVTRICGHTLLSDENPADLPEDDFYVIPVYAKRIRDQFYGPVESAKDPQREFNKRISQSIDVVNRMAAYGYFYDNSTFLSPEDEEKWRNVSSTPGFNVKVRDASSPPTAAQGVKFPTEIVSMAEAAAANIRAMISIADMEKAGANTSAQALMQYEKNKLIGTEYLFDNLSFAKKKLGRLLIGILQKYYDAERVARIVISQNMKSPQQIGGEPAQNYDMEAIIQMLETADLSRVDVVVGESTWSPTQRVANLMILTDLMNKGAPIPFEMIAEFMDLPEDVKAKAIQAVQAQQQQQALSAQETSQAEIQKSLIGQGLYPPKVLEEQGLAPPSQPPGPPQQEAAIPPPYTQPDAQVM